MDKFYKAAFSTLWVSLVGFTIYACADSNFSGASGKGAGLAEEKGQKGGKGSKIGRAHV